MTSRQSRLESTAFYVLIATIVLAPLAFWSSSYVALDAVKTIVIAVGTLAAAIMYGAVAIRERSLVLPPQSVVAVGALFAVALAASAWGSGHFAASFFGQGFEAGTGSFFLLLCLSAAVAAVAVFRRTERTVVIYAALVCSFLVLTLYEALRLAFGPGFASLGILSAVTDTVFGGWHSLAGFAMVIVILSLLAIAFLPLSRLMRSAYWILLALGLAMAILIDAAPVWLAAALVCLGLSIYLSMIRPRPVGGAMASALKRIAWLPVLLCLVSAVFAWDGSAIVGPAVAKLGASYSELSLPWQMTLDVATGTLKDHPLLGIGPNRFTEAFLSYKPSSIDQTDAWGVEFTNGFGLIPSYTVTLGLVGLILWVLLLVAIGVLGKRSLRASALPADPSARFIVVSSFAAASFLWILSIIYVPSVTLLFSMFVLTGIWLGASAAYGSVKPFAIAPRPEQPSRLFSATTGILMAIAVVWALVFLKDTAALGYFAAGLGQLGAPSGAAQADADFHTAVDLNPADVYWRARTEAALAEAQALAASSTPSSASLAAAAAASTTAAETAALGNQAFTDAENAVAADTGNYYNYLSEARVAEFAVSLHMPQGYQEGVTAYEKAISLNPGNPSLYLSLARLEASQNQFDAALQTVGTSLQVKPNYLDGVFLLSQIEAAKGNLPDAITAAKFALTLDAANPLLYFQLGLLQYMSGDYADATTSLVQAVKLQPQYANAQYFLGLSYARLGQISAAADQFGALASTNPGNQEVALILANLRAGKSPFTGEAPQTVTPPEKRLQLPIPDKKPR